MKIKTVVAVFAGCSALFLALPAFGQYYGTYNGPALSNGQVETLGYTGHYQTTALGGGAGIYSGTVNGYSAGIICDDFKDEVHAGQTWTANAYQASTLSKSNIDETLYGSAIGITGYAEVGYLVNLMFTSSTVSHADISAAIWDITDQHVLDNKLGKSALDLVKSVEKMFKGKYSKAEAWLDQQTDLWIMTPNPHTKPGKEPAQEMWIKTAGPTSVPVSAPEGGAALLYLLLAGVACSGAMRLRTRNTFVNPIA